jgi:hypothetical protein
MALSLRRGAVSRINEAREDLLRLEVDGAPCIAYPRLTGPVEVGDDVIVNVQARELELGSGGFDILYVNLTRGLDGGAERGAHVMNLPYTPLQAAVRHVEEDGVLADDLGRLPVVCCSLHSQLAPVCAAIGGEARVAYVQLAGGALPVSLSDTVRALETRGLLEIAIAVAPCFDGDAQAVTVYSALAWAKQAGFDIVVCAIGPGIVGTGTPLGHGGLAAVEALNAAGALGGFPILADRRSDADPRARHRGRSHHTKAILDLALVEATVATEEPAGWREACEGIPLSHMGRGPDEDASFFSAAFAAGRHARTLLAD